MTNVGLTALDICSILKVIKPRTTVQTVIIIIIIIIIICNLVLGFCRVMLSKRASANFLVAAPGRAD